MKILEVVFSLSSGGGERVVIDLCNEFAARGHEVTLLTMLDIDNFPQLSFNRQFLTERVILKKLGVRYPTPCAIYKISNFLKVDEPDVVHMHLNVLPYFFPSILFGSRKIKYYHTLHSVAPAACGYKGQRPVNRWFYKTGRITPVTISKLCNHSFQEFYHLPPAAMIENGRSKPIPTEKEPSVRKEIEKMKQHPDDKVFIQVGTIGNVKNQKLSVEVFRAMHQKGVHAILLLVGKDNPSEPEYGCKARKNCPSNCFFLGESNHVVDYLVNSDYFLMPSQYEGLPISLLEAMACGCIPVCTAVGGIPDVITDGKNGYLSPEPEYNILLNLLEKIIFNDGKIKRDDIIKYYVENYDSSIFAGKYLDLFQLKQALF